MKERKKRKREMRKKREYIEERLKEREKTKKRQRENKEKTAKREKTTKTTCNSASPRSDIRGTVMRTPWAKNPLGQKSTRARAKNPFYRRLGQKNEARWQAKPPCVRKHDD